MSRVGPYRLTGKVTESAIWTLSSGEHESLPRRVFVRSARGMLAPDSPLLAPLVREAERTARLSHPSVLALHDLVRTDTELAVVLEHGEGPLLAARLREGRVTFDEAWAIGLAVARGVAHGHGRSVVHGGPSPRDVVLSPSGARVFGFGLVGGPSPLDGDDETQDFLAPEVRAGEPPTPASDVFSIGALLFFLLTGEDAFASPPDVPERRARSAAPRRLDDVRPDAPPKLARLVARCLAEAPDDRFADARELVEEWERQGETRPGPAPAGRLLGVTVEREPAPREVSMWVTLGGQLFVLFALVLGLSLLHARTPDGELVEHHGSLDLVPERAGWLRVLARPWAHVYVDGVRVETTPFAKPIPLREGLHDVVLKHPQALDVKRHVRIGMGETAVLEVEMAVPPPPPPPRASASSDRRSP